VSRVGPGLGDGLGATQRFIEEIAAPLFGLADLEDGYRTPPLTAGQGLVVTTDTFLVDPVEFPGGDLGALAAAGAVNDLLAAGADPLYLTLGVLASEDLDHAVLERCLKSLARHAARCGAQVVAGDT
jgi:hydrogenase expression/formation protein HypE